MAQHTLQGVIRGVVNGPAAPLFEFCSNCAGRIVRVELKSTTVNANGGATFDVNRHDPTTEAKTTIYTDQGQRPVIAAGQKRASWVPSAGQNFPVSIGQIISVDADIIPAGGIGPIICMVYLEDDLGVAARSTVEITTASIGNGVRANIEMPLGKASYLYSVETDIPARVQFYIRADLRDADADRPIGRLPVGEPNENGLIDEEVTTAGHLLSYCVPVPIAVNLEDTVTGNIPMAVTNMSGASGPITIIVTRLPLEN